MHSSLRLPTPCRLSLLISLAFSGTNTAIAQTTFAPPTQPAPPVMLQQVVISANRAEQLADDLTVSMDVIKQSDMESGQMTDIRDVAKSLPNISVKRAPARFVVSGLPNTTGQDSNAGFTIRGLGGNRVLMLEDGVRLPRSYSTGNNAFGRDAVELGLLKRIEIVRGPTSALYGSDGLAGLVNFITLEPLDYLQTGNTVKDSAGRVWLAASTDDQGISTGATLARRAGESAEWSITATTRRAKGLDNMGSNDAAHVDRTTPNPQTDQSHAFLGKLVLHPSPGQKHVLTLAHIEKATDVELLSSRAKPPYSGTAAQQAASVIDESANTDGERDRLSWSASYALASTWADKLQTSLSWQDASQLQTGQTLRYDQGVRARQTSYEERTWQATVQAEKTWHLSDQWSQVLRYGFDYAQTDVSSLASGSDPAPLAAYKTKRFFPETRDTTQALYLQSELQHERWSITPGVRVDQFAIDVLSQDGYYPNLSPTPGKSLSGTQVSPKLGVLYRATSQWSVYGNYASGFRAPEGQQVNSALEAFNVKLLPNPNLKPEESRNIELGLRTRLNNLSLDVAVFSGKYTNLIQEKKNFGTANGQPASATNPTLFQTVNIDRATIHGFEMRGSYQWGTVAGGKLSMPFSYGKTRGTNDTTGRPLSSIDPAKLTLGLKYEAADWQLALDITHQAAKEVSELETPFIPKSTTQRQFLTPSATTLDLHGQWRFRKNMRLNFGISNLTDQKVWNWSDVQGLSANPAAPLLPVVDAYTQPGRHVSLSLVMDF